jgi:hypothetical protein
VPVLFAGVLFLNALLLFWVQPLFARMVLPVLGGSPSVWTTCMLFFQAALLVGYAYSHAGLRWFGIRQQAVLHSVIVWIPLLLLPIEVTHVGAALATQQPITWILTIVATTVGVPFVVLASTAPLLQRWFAAANRGSSDPYWLYAASNAGSLVALLAFPMLLEPLLPAQAQASTWKICYGIVAALLTTCAFVVIRRGPAATLSTHVEDEQSSADVKPSARTRFQWLALSFAPSTLMLGVTTYISTDVAAVPLLWVLPLSCYLLTFIVAFGWFSEAAHALTRRMLPRVLLPLMFVVLIGLPVPTWITIPLHIVAFTVLALLCHGELARNRPGVRHLTEFYLWLAAGGVLGGVFNTLIAPQIFTSVAEYPIAIAVACLLCVSREQLVETLSNPRRLARPALAAAMAAALLIGERLTSVPSFPVIALLGAPVMMGVSVARDSARFSLTIAGLLGALLLGNAVAPVEGGHVLYADRTFFGVYRVRTDADKHLVLLAHGTTTHGAQVDGDTNPAIDLLPSQESDRAGVRDARTRRAIGGRHRAWRWNAGGVRPARCLVELLRNRSCDGTHCSRRSLLSLSRSMRLAVLRHPRGCTADARSTRGVAQCARARCVQLRRDPNAPAHDRGAADLRITPGVGRNSGVPYLESAYPPAPRRREARA